MYDYFIETKTENVSLSEDDIAALKKSPYRKKIYKQIESPYSN